MDKITLQMEGEEKFDMDVSIETFIRQIELMKIALKETNRVVSLDESEKCVFVVSNLSHSSPAAIEIKAFNRKNGAMAGFVILAMYEIVSCVLSGEVPKYNMDYNALTAFKNFSSLIGKGVNKLWIIHGNNRSEITPDFGANIDRILGPDEYETGSVTGLLQHLNVHSENICSIYPTMPGVPKFKCVFTNELRAKVVGSADKYVTVYGRKKFKRNNSHPYEIVIEDIEILPSPKVGALSELYGIAPSIVDDIDSVDFIRRLRDEWQARA